MPPVPTADIIPEVQLPAILKMFFTRAVIAGQESGKAKMILEVAERDRYGLRMEIVY